MKLKIEPFEKHESVVFARLRLGRATCGTLTFTGEEWDALVEAGTVEVEVVPSIPRLCACGTGTAPYSCVSCGAGLCDDCRYVDPWSGADVCKECLGKEVE